MALLDVKTHIVVDEKAGSLKFTVPTAIRDEMNWRVKLFSDYVSRDVTDHALQITSRSAVSNRVGFVVGMFAYHYALNYETIEQFFSLSFKTHLEMVNSHIDQVERVQSVPDCSFSYPISPEELHEVFLVVFKSRAKLVMTDLEKNNRLHHFKIDTDYSQIRWFDSRAALVRLQDINPQETFMTRDEWDTRIQRCKEIIEILKGYHDLAVDVNVTISAEAQERVITPISELTQLYTDAQTASDVATWIGRFIEFKSQLDAIVSEIKSLTKDYDATIQIGKNLRDEVVQITPAK